ncbi:perlucin-like [Uranotaenia lowii]|uniref:perlucin-like n=1 Tax=Uranotaenia lowii TaxID=190385 RepID=UPI00247A765D|nr:perlucin-like [Uranotaenia lowii]
MWKVTLALLALSSLQISADHIKCKVNGRYFIPNFTANWFKAVEYCSYLEMRLVVITSAEEQAKVVETVKASDKFNNRSSSMWIGGSDLAEEGDFYWHSTGTRLRYSNWGTKQPDNARSVEHCMEIQFIPTENWLWHWNDRDCKTQRYFICENLEPGKEIELF